MKELKGKTFVKIPDPILQSVLALQGKEGSKVKGKM